jgi:UDP-N-acetylglucosamine/UDP-N-acetylgalactosamine diphosphorylase
MAINPPSVNELEILEQVLAQHGQQHVIRFWSELNEAERQGLKAQIESIDWDEIDELVRDHGIGEQWESLAERAEAPPAVTVAEFKNAATYSRAFETGADALRRGQVAFVLTAGGQGSRLGFEHPKGMFPIGPVSNRSLFQIMIEQTLARARQFKKRIPIYIMTSPQTDAESREFLERNQWFGYPRADIRVFCQGMMPAVEQTTGRVLLEEKGKIATSPDGHGGMLKALDRSGCLADMRKRGIESVFYGQIDNPLLQICNPALIGFHLLRKSEMTTQVVRKRSPLQKVGNVVRVDGQVRIIEYSDLPERFAEQRNADGSLKLWAGSIAVHIFDRQFLERATKHADRLPFHRAFKKVPHIDRTGRTVQPTENNAIKFERFVFDLLPHADNALVCEVDPAEGFAALKNAPGAASETPEWVQQAIVDLHASWIRKCGGQVAPGVTVEISPFYALDEAQLAERLKTPINISKPTFVADDSGTPAAAKGTLHATIMAGGAGTRFWPASRKLHPKQLLTLIGDRSMLQSTVDRLRGLCDEKDLLIVSNEALVEQIRQQLPSLPREAIVGEPAKRDTAPCVGLSAILVSARDANATMVVMPADHVIRPTEKFQAALRFAQQLVEKDPTRIVTFGIKPSYPAEVYGYIERDNAKKLAGEFPAFGVKRFREKPDAKTAAEFLKNGDFYWNAGIFVWKAATILQALRDFEPEMLAHLDAISRKVGNPDFAATFRDEFCKIKGKSIDFAVMERYSNVVVVEAAFEWDDVGNWTSLERLNSQDESGNTTLGRHLAIRSTNTIVVGDAKHVIATIGVDDLIIVQTPDATLVAKKSDEAAVKQIVELIEKNGWQEYL